jgi:predicted DsbA family dithiol-disulfide isomerase
VADKVREDATTAKKLSVSSTPSFPIGTITGDRLLKVVRHESGAIPTEVFTRMIDDVLATANR